MTSMAPHVGMRRLYLDHDERYEIFVVKAAERPHLLCWKATASSAKEEVEEEEEMSCLNGCSIGEDEKKAEEEEEGEFSSASSASSSSLSSLNSPPPPFTDGTDLPGWRCQRIAPCMDGCRNRRRHNRHRRFFLHGNGDNCVGEGSSSSMDGTLEEEEAVDIEHPLDGIMNVGAGSMLVRRESQFPFLTSGTCNHHGHDMTNIDDDDSDGSQYCCRWHHDKHTKYYNVVPPTPEREIMTLGYDEACLLVNVNDQGGGGKIPFFCREYEMKNRPAKILGATVGWSAMPPPLYTTHDGTITDNARGDAADGGTEVGEIPSTMVTSGEEVSVREGWTFSTLLRRFENVAFRFSDGHGEMLTLSTYARYITNPEGWTDDSPLGIYDSMFGDECSPTCVLTKEYEVPRCFGQDLFDLATEDVSDDCDNEHVELVDAEQRTNNVVAALRPPYRWILIGPERSGTGMHVDPLCTNAWVTVLQGRKRWLLFPPDTPYNMIGMHDDDGSPQIPSSIWFRDYYDMVTSTTWPEQFRPVEVEQRPGETVFVPACWPHLVLNLELTVAVSHNYASEHGPYFDRMWMETVRDEPDFARRWRMGLRKNGREDLAMRMVRG